jgi:DNA polymerase III subunit beta
MTDFLSALLDDDPHDSPTLRLQTVMKFEIKKFVLQALLDRAITVVPTRDVMPVLKCFQFQVDPQRLRVVASDVEHTLVASTTMVSVQESGVAVFPARKLVDIVRAAEDGTVAITVTNTTATVAIGRASWTLKLLGGDDYPPMPAIAEAEFVTIGRETFLGALLAVRYAASRDPNRASLNIIDIADGKLTASDGSRIQQIRVSDFPINLRLPISAVDDLMRLLKSTDVESVDVGQSELKIIFRFASDVFIVSKFFANFPAMEAQMLRPALENKHTLDVDRVDLVAAIKRVRINADSESSAIALDLARNALTISAVDKFGNTAAETIFCTYSGPEHTVVINHKYLAEMINTYGDATCTFKLGDDTRTRRTPLLLRNATTGSTGALQQMQSDWLGQA